MGDVERGNIDLMHRLQNPFCGSTKQLLSTQIKPHSSRKTENLQNFGSKRVGIPPSHPPISPYSQNFGRKAAHRRSISDVPFGLQTVKRELSSDMNIEGEVVDDLMSAYMNMDSIDALNSCGSDETRVSDTEAESGVIEAVASTTRHCRSVSMDSFIGSMSFGDGNANGFNLEFGHGQFTVAEMKKIMANEKLAEIALADPKRVKRILANRQSAARSKERKTRYISELEQKVQTLQSEATALSAKLTFIQRDSARLTGQNNELKFRLQAIERQAQLQEALSEALTAEVQRLKIETGELNHEAMSKRFGQQLHINPQTFQHQEKQQQSSQNNDSQEHQKANDPNTGLAMKNESAQVNP